MLTPTARSPLDLLQEGLRSQPWLLLVGTILLNRTRGRSVQGPMEAIVERWPSAESLAQAKAGELAQILAPLGLQHRRANSLIGLARAWVELVEIAQLEGVSWPLSSELCGLPGIGEYALDSYRIFVDGVLDPDAPVSGDERLAAYCHWARTGEEAPAVAKRPRKLRGTTPTANEAEVVLRLLEAMVGWSKPSPTGIRPVTVADVRAIVRLIGVNKSTRSDAM